jgi:hypothetical protein
MQTYVDGSGQGPYTISLTDHLVAEWSRCAKAMYARGANAEGHALSVGAAKVVLPIGQYDRVSAIYRAWLCFDEPKVAAPFVDVAWIDDNNGANPQRLSNAIRCF